MRFVYTGYECTIVHALQRHQSKGRNSINKNSNRSSGTRTELRSTGRSIIKDTLTRCNPCSCSHVAHNINSTGKSIVASLVLRRVKHSYSGSSYTNLRRSCGMSVVSSSTWLASSTIYGWMSSISALVHLPAALNLPLLSSTIQNMTQVQLLYVIATYVLMSGLIYIQRRPRVSALEVSSNVSSTE